MENASTQQEILIMTNTSFSHRRWSDRENKQSNKIETDKEELEKACWNGMLPELLPEICNITVNEKKLFLWQIKDALSFIELDLGEHPEIKDNYYSIDP